MKSYRDLRSGRQRVVAFLFPSDVLGLAEGGRYCNNAAGADARDAVTAFAWTC